MRKTLALLLTVLLLAGLCACGGGDEPQAEATPTPAPTVDPASQANADSVKATPPASATDAEPAPGGNYDIAMQYLGRPVAELYAALGEPLEEPTYGPSCLTEGAEDGILTYDGFYVWTVRTATDELIQDVYPAD